MRLSCQGLAVTVFIIFATAAQGGPLDIAYSDATHLGKASCAAKYPAGDSQGAAYFSATTGSCWSCPKGYERSWIHFVSSAKACVRKDPKRHARATKRGKPGCPGKAFRKSGACYVCPTGYMRTIKISFRNPGSDPKACMRVGISREAREAFLAAKLPIARGLMEQDKSAIQQAGRVAAALARTGTKRPNRAQLRAAGFETFQQDAEDEGFPTTSWGPTFDFSVIGGMAFAKGEVFDGSAYRDFKSTAWTAGLSAGVDVSYEVGRWKVDQSGFAGQAQGLVLAAGYGGGLSLTFWWNMDGDYIGWSVAPQGGVSLEAEYIAGQTELL